MSRIFALLICLSAPFLAAAEPYFSAMPPHPRLFMNASEQAAVFKALASNPLLSKFHARFLAECDAVLETEPHPYEKPDGKRLRPCATEVIRRTFMLSWAYRHTGDEKYSLRAQRELLNAADFPDWNPKQFLDTAELALAFAIGYDWLYESLDADVRRSLERAVFEKAFKAAEVPAYARFYGAGHNWN